MIKQKLKLINVIKIHQRPKKKANIQLVKSDMGHLDTEDYDLFIPPTDLELNYGSEFLKIHDVIVDRLNSEYDKGIILLHGDPGTGKTSYIKHLTSLVKDKDILFIPPSMAEMLSEPSIIPFLMDHKNSILIIEDAERVISDREGNGSPAGVSNILNLTDGILGDCLNIQVIATFNMKREKIDQALLRKGRLIAEHKFEKLSIDDTNKLLKHLEKNQEVREGMVLADIYNIDTEVYKTSTKGNKIGF
jgi:SpoVK/Ycf46/Vps4 family AAA+-type ATPase